MMTQPSNLSVSTSDTPVTSPLSSVKSLSTSSSRSLSPDSNHPSVVNSPQSAPSTISNGSDGPGLEIRIEGSDGSSIRNDSGISGGYRSGSISTVVSDEESPETLPREMEKLTLNTKPDALFPRVRPVNVSQPNSRTSPLYSPHAVVFVQKDGQMYEVPIADGGMGSPGSVVGSLSPGTYFPSTWPAPTTGLTLRQISPSRGGVHDFGQPSPSGATAIYNTEARSYVQLVPPHDSTPQQFHFASASITRPGSTQAHYVSTASQSYQSSAPASPQKLHLGSTSGGSGTTTPRGGNSSGGSSPPAGSEGGGSSEALSKDSKIDNKHTAFRQEVIRDVFPDQPTTLLSPSPSVGVVLPPVTVPITHTPPPSGDIRLVPSNSLPTQFEQRQKVPSYAIGYPYVYYDPATQITYGYPIPVSPSPYPIAQQPPTTTSTGSPSYSASPAGGPSGVQGQAQTVAPHLGLDPQTLMIPNSNSSRAVYQLPLTGGEWGNPFYVPRPRGPRVRPGICLFVFHIPPSVTDEELFGLFSTCGRVLSAKVMRNSHTGESKGYGFANMANQRDAEQAIGTLHGYYWKNKYLKVSYKKKRYYSRN